MPTVFTPPPLNGDNIIRCSYFSRYFGQRILSIFHLRLTVGGSPTYIEGISAIAIKLAADLLGSGFLGDIRARQVAAFEYEFLRVQRVAPTRDVFYSQDLGLPGLASDPGVAPNLALTTNKRTLRPGRHGHGDTHLTGFPQSAQAEGLWDPALVSGVDADLFADLTTPWDSGGTGPAGNWCIWDPTPVTGGGADIVATETRREVKTMHRRTVGLGE